MASDFRTVCSISATVMPGVALTVIPSYATLRWTTDMSVWPSDPPDRVQSVRTAAPTSPLGPLRAPLPPAAGRAQRGVAGRQALRRARPRAPSARGPVRPARGHGPAGPVRRPLGLVGPLGLVLSEDVRGEDGHPPRPARASCDLLPRGRGSRSRPVDALRPAAVALARLHTSDVSTDGLSRSAEVEARRALGRAGRLAAAHPEQAPRLRALA